jgi:2-polyprenyl-3-methyl-5-hydroxy-6-metoxy-1,4-benzoquinol methylase
VLDRLEEGAAVCDVGCGQGRAVLKLAEAFPASTFQGFDAYGPAIETANRRAKDAGLDHRVDFAVRDVAQGLPETYDLVTTFDVLHDSVDPGALLRAIHAALSPHGRYLCLEINCADRREDNTGPLGTILHGLSLAYCLPVSMMDGGAGLGTLGMPQSKLTELAGAAGFTDVVRAPIDDPFSALYVLTP